MVKLDTPYDGSLFHIAVGILQADVDGLLHVFCDTLKLQLTERSESKTTNFAVRALDINEEGVDRQNSQILVLLSVVCQVEVNHFFHDNVVGP